MNTALRDRFFALSAGSASEDEVARYRAEVDATDTEAAAVIDGLSVSWHPTARFKALRFLDAERIDEPVRELFARPSKQAPHLAAGFVDPRELSFAAAGGRRPRPPRGGREQPLITTAEATPQERRPLLRHHSTC